MSAAPRIAFMMTYPLANLFGIENWMLILVVGLLIFGRRLPEVGRSLGKGIVEFKKGLQGIEDDIDTAGQAKPQQSLGTSNQIGQNLPAGQISSPSNPQAAAAAAGYKFDPYTGKPIRVDAVTGQPMRFDPYTGKPLTEEATANTQNG
jgi:sec-independent protein translocase protein TatA